MGDRHMNREWFFRDLLDKVIAESYDCGNYKGCHKIHVNDWKHIMSDDDDLTIMTLLEDLQVLYIAHMDDLVWEEGPMFSYKVNFDEIDHSNLSTYSGDNPVSKLLNRIMR